MFKWVDLGVEGRRNGENVEMERGIGKKTEDEFGGKNKRFRAI